MGITCRQAPPRSVCILLFMNIYRRSSLIWGSTQWEVEGLYSKFGETDADILLGESDEDILMEEVPDSDIDESSELSDNDVKEEDESEADDEPKTPLPQQLDQRSLPYKDEEDQNYAKMSSWLL